MSMPAIIITTPRTIPAMAMAASTNPCARWRPCSRTRAKWMSSSTTSRLFSNRELAPTAPFIVVGIRTPTLSIRAASSKAPWPGISPVPRRFRCDAKTRNSGARTFCSKALCATLGPVGEPYTIGFPKPEEFFGFLATGKYTLVECYARTLNLTSWMCTLIGDPLYNPYKAAPKLKASQVHPSPKGGHFLLGEKFD